MKAEIPKPVHETYLKHRRDVKWKILAPVVASMVLCFACSALVYVATFSYGGDVARWAEISTIYLAIPTIIFLVILFAIIGGLVYLLTRLLDILPNYTYQAQGLFYRIKKSVRRGADAVATPIIIIDSVGASINRIFGRR
jgi:predicted PurR-regulated permease PerM